MAKKIGKLENVEGVKTFGNDNGNSHFDSGVKPILGIVSRTNLGPNSNLQLANASYTPSEIMMGKGDGGHEEEQRALSSTISFLGGEKRTEYQKHEKRKFFGGVRNIGLAALFASSLGFWAYKTGDMSKQIKTKDKQIAELTQTNQSYVQRFEEQKIALENIDAMEKGIRKLTLSYGSESPFESLGIAIGGLKEIFKNTPIFGETNYKIFEDVSEAMKEFDDMEIWKNFQLKAHPVNAYKEIIPGVGVFRIGDLEKMAMGQDYSEKPTIFFIPVGGSKHPNYDASNVDLNNSNSRTVYTRDYPAIVLEDYMHQTEGRRIFTQLVGPTDENGMPYGISTGHFADYSNIFPRYRIGTIIKENSKIGFLGWTGVMNGIHAHFGFYKATKVDSKTGIGSGWEKTDPYTDESKTYGRNFVLVPLETLPKAFQTDIVKYFQSKN